MVTMLLFLQKTEKHLELLTALRLKIRFFQPHPPADTREVFSSARVLGFATGVTEILPLRGGANVVEVFIPEKPVTPATPVTLDPKNKMQLPRRISGSD